MLTVYRRHLSKCKFRSMGDRRCKCPVWVHGKLDGDFIRQSLHTRNWEAAVNTVRSWEVDKKPVDMTVADAGGHFLKECEARVGAEQYGKYKLLIRELKEVFGNRLVRHLWAQDVVDYRASWRLGPISAAKKLERLKTFVKFCIESGWMQSNPARPLKPPTIKPKPTLPFTDEEMEKILWACEVYPDRPRGRRKQVKAFVLLLRFSGLRIRDGVCVRKNEIAGGKLCVDTAKTGRRVFVPLPDVVLDALASIERPDLDYFFWSGNGNPKSAVADWQRTLKRLFGIAGIKGHAHRFRDTFSVSLLQNGVSLENVAVLLGHSSIRVTEKHYAPWVKERQEKLEREVKKAWG